MAEPTPRPESDQASGTPPTAETAGPTLDRLMARVSSRLEAVPSEPNDTRRSTRAEDIAAFRRAVGSRYAAARLETYQVDHPPQRVVVAKVTHYARVIRERIEAGQGVLLYGPSGTGKDHLLCGLAHEAFAAGVRVVAIVGAELQMRMRGSIDGGEREEAVCLPLVAAPVLLLSDPIASRQTLTEFQADTLYRIIDRRYREGRPTWISLNVSTAEEADTRLTPAIVDRLQHGALVCRCDWPSYRRPLT